MKDPMTYVIMSGKMFLTSAATCRLSSEYPDALKYNQFNDALRDYRNAERKGFKLRIVQSYGTADETTVWKG